VAPFVEGHAEAREEVSRDFQCNLTFMAHIGFSGAFSPLSSSHTARVGRLPQRWAVNPEPTPALFMMDNDTTGIVRLVGLFGLAASILVWALAERLERRKVFVTLAAGAAILSALVYFLGVMAAADSGAHRFLPRFP
jgi:hypothetical protein